MASKRNDGDLLSEPYRIIGENDHQGGRRSSQMDEDEDVLLVGSCPHVGKQYTVEECRKLIEEYEG